MNAPEAIDLEASQLLADLDDSHMNNPYEKDDQFRQTKRMTLKEIDAKNKLRNEMLLSEEK